MLRLFIRDVETGVTVECPETKDHFAPDPDNPDTLRTLIKWSHKDAVGALVDKLAEREGKTPPEILFSDRAPFEIYAVWEVKTFDGE